MLEIIGFKKFLCLGNFGCPRNFFHQIMDYWLWRASSPITNTNYFFFLENGWEQKTRLPIVVGPVDGTHIPNNATMQPYLNSQDHYSYKMKYTINVKSVCDYNGKFIDVDIRWPGGTH